MNSYTYKIYTASVAYWKTRNVLMFAGDQIAKHAVWHFCCDLRKARCVEPSVAPKGRAHLMVELHPDDMASAEIFARRQEIAQLKRERVARLVDNRVK